jgi:hypothetical protein
VRQDEAEVEITCLEKVATQLELLGENFKVFSF